jgi:hypothetical protein
MEKLALPIPRDAKRPLWKIVTETVERTSESWKTREHRDALPKGISAAIEKQILGVTMAVQKQV